MTPSRVEIQFGRRCSNTPPRPCTRRARACDASWNCSRRSRSGTCSTWRRQGRYPGRRAGADVMVVAADHAANARGGSQAGCGARAREPRGGARRRGRIAVRERELRPRHACIAAHHFADHVRGRGVPSLPDGAGWRSSTTSRPIARYSRRRQAPTSPTRPRPTTASRSCATRATAAASGWRSGGAADGGRLRRHALRTARQGDGPPALGRPHGRFAGDVQTAREPAAGRRRSDAVRFSRA